MNLTRTILPMLCPIALALVFTVVFTVMYIRNISPPLVKPGARRLTFDVEPTDLVAMTISDTSRYDLTNDGQAEYAALMPSGGHTVHISSEDGVAPRPYTVSLFHQLRCLEIYHREYLKPTPRQVTWELQGCLNYLRQSLVCHANTRLESIKNSAIQAEKQYDTVCRDWTKVYEAAEKNYRDYTSSRWNSKVPKA